MPLNSSYKPEAHDIIQRFNLKPHPEGGYSQLLYQDPDNISHLCLPPEYEGPRSFWNGIYYLLPEGSCSILHRIRMSELWNFYLGGPLKLYDISPSGELKITVLGHDLSNGQQLAYVFPKGHWISAKPLKGALFSFVSCITSPGFTLEDWEKGERENLTRDYPHLKTIITMLTD